MALIAHCEQIYHRCSRGVARVCEYHILSVNFNGQQLNNKTKVLTSQKSVSDSSSQTLFSAEPVTAGNTSAFAG